LRWRIFFHVAGARKAWLSAACFWARVMYGRSRQLRDAEEFAV
jgi:hypothetical protein